MPHKIFLSDIALEFLRTIDEKSKSICKKNLEKLSSPYPGKGIGDKEKIIVAGVEMFRLPIGRTYTAFYIIDEKQKTVRILEIISIEAAHKKY
ncbi:MAG: type II toxin-antitoxin system RelE/ParE family toxin [Candidatus Nanoarchaeia archaeon]